MRRMEGREGGGGKRGRGGGKEEGRGGEEEGRGRGGGVREEEEGGVELDNIQVVDPNRRLVRRGRNGRAD